MKKIFLIILIAILALLLLALVFAPGIAKRYAVNHSKALFGRQIAIEKVKINYFTATIRLIDFKMFEANDRDLFVAFDTLLVNTEPLHLFNDELVVETFYLKGLQASIIQNDSLFNFDDLIAFYTSADEPEPAIDSSTSNGFKFEFSNIAIKGANLYYHDVPLKKTFHPQNLNLEIPYISWDQQHQSEAGLKFYFENGGYFQSAIHIDPNNGNFTAQVTINQLELEPFYEYTLDLANLGSLSGLLNTSIQLTGNIDSPEQIIVSGPFDLYQLKTTDERQLPFVEVKHLRGRIGKIDYYNQHYAFDSLILYNPRFYVEFYDSTISVLEATDYYSYFPEVEAPADGSDGVGESNRTTDSEAEPELYYGFNHLQINDGMLELVDKTTPEPFAYNLSKIEMSTDSLFSNNNWVTIYADMLLNNRGKLVAELGYFPADPMELSVNYVISDFLLSDLNIYSRHYMGFPILYGDMYYKSETKINKGKLNSNNKLVIQHAELGDKRGGLYNLPLKFALFLLKDRNGVIDLDIPVRGDLNDPTVKLGKIIWNTLKNLVIKVAAAPFDFLAGVINVDPKDIQSINYNYLDTAFTADRQRQVDLLLELEQKKESLEIELVYFNDVEKEKKQIAVRLAGEAYRQQTGRDYRMDEPGFIGYLKTQTGNDTIDVAAASQQLIEAAVIDSVALEVRDYRRSSIEKYLVKTSDSTAIQVFIPDPKSPKNVAAEPHFEVKYSMKESIEKQ